ncbi:MAG: alanine--tRNA ligase [Planctomycetota bacterium]
MPTPTPGNQNPKKTAAAIRQQFIDFFVQKAGHTAVASSPVVPHDDPTLLFTNAGMNQFKDVFLGTGNREYTRAVDTQKCIRAGGKHNDLDDVGKDTYHHTFFEMLGNWSFGDYFKTEAIDWAWELLTSKEWWGLDPARLHATYFEGDPELGLEPDLEARDLWLKYLPAERVHPGNKKDNFWEMGDTGPCGPCSELHYDRSPDKSGASLVNADGQDTVVEIWNLVFIQFNRLTTGGLEPLPAKHVDTGMGFERIVRVLQGKTSNYDTDVFSPLFAAIQEVTGAKAYDGGVSGGDSLSNPIDIAYRVIADHIRTLTFALTDGAHCGNKGRNAVLRTILRRAVRYGHQTLGVEEPFFYKLVPAVVEVMGEAFPEITKSVDAVQTELKEEEIAFRATLERGIVIFDKAVEGLSAGQTLEGATAFDLEATYGFPFSLTQVMAEERGLTVDVPGYDQAKAQHADISRGEAGGADAKASLAEQVARGLDAGWFVETNFTGHEFTEAPFQANTLHLFKKVGETYESATAAQAGDEVAAVFQMTPFYAEAGGQVGDTGGIMIKQSPSSTGGDIVRLKVDDTIKVGGVHLHLGQLTAGKIDDIAGEVHCAMAVDAKRRALTQNNHTTTHVMNRALRDHVNAEANQKGSLVDDEKLRFDFSHGSALTPEEIAAVEKQVNDDIAKDLPVYAQVVPQEDALKINGLRAVFGEKYPPHVRVVSIGVPVADLVADPDKADWPGYSIEFCGGTHLAKTGDAEGFCVVSQEAVSKGVRRVTALTGPAAHKSVATGEQLLTRIEFLADAPAESLAEKIDSVSKTAESSLLPLSLNQKIRAGLAELGEKVKAYQKEQGNQAEQGVVAAAQQIAESQSGSVIVAEVPGADGKTLRTAMDVVRKKHSDSALFLAANAGGKVAMIASVPKPLIESGFKAGDWIKHVAPIVGGGGGGRPDMAQAGGKDPAKLPEALNAAKQFAEESNS